MRCASPTRLIASRERCLRLRAWAYSSGKVTFFSTDARGNSSNVWKTKPIRRQRMKANADCGSRDTSSPSRRYWPEVGRSRQPRMCISVLFPEPDGPMRATYSPRRMVRLTPFRARMTSLPTRYTLVTSRTSITGDGGGGSAAYSSCRLRPFSGSSRTTSAKAATGGVGTRCTWPQCGHFARLPAAASGMRRRCPQPGFSHLNWMGMICLTLQQGD